MVVMRERIASFAFAFVLLMFLSRRTTITKIPDRTLPTYLPYLPYLLEGIVGATATLTITTSATASPSIVKVPSLVLHDNINVIVFLLLMINTIYLGL